MKINKITVYYSATVQMRQFEPVVISASAETQVDPGETFEIVFNKTYKKIQGEVDNQINKKKIVRKESFLEEDGIEKTI